MSKSLWLIPLLLTLVAIRSYSSGFQFIGEVTSFERMNNTIVIKCQNASAKITVLCDDLFRVELSNGGGFRTDNSYSVLPVELAPSQLDVEDFPGEIRIRTAELALIIKKSPCRLAFYDLQGNLICKDHDAFGTGWNGSKVCCWKELHDECFYGLGEKTRGLNKRGNVYTMWNSDIPAYTSTQDPLYQSHPFFIGLYQGRGFGFSSIIAIVLNLILEPGMISFSVSALMMVRWIIIFSMDHRLKRCWRGTDNWWEPCRCR